MTAADSQVETMPAVSVQPAAERIGSPLFTVETARLAGLLSAQKRREEKQRLQELLHPRVQPVVSPVERRIARIEEQLTAIELKMAKNPPANVLRDLSQAHSRMFDVWCTLTGTEKPGTRRKRRNGRESQSGSSAEPIPLQVASPADLDGYNLTV